MTAVMISVRRAFGGWAASWNDGTEFFDPDRERAIELARADLESRRPDEIASVVEMNRRMTEHDYAVLGRAIR